MKHFAMWTFACTLMAIAAVGAGWMRSAPAAAPTAAATVLVDTNSGHGSGVHIGNGLYITAAHVTKDAEHLTVKLDTGEDFPAEVLWANEAYDVALIKTRPPGAAAARLDCAAPELATGTIIEIIGNPLGLRNIHTWGRVSRATEQGKAPRYSLIADITIAPGNSGGPAFDREGRLVGIVVAVSLARTGPMSSSIVPLSYVVPASAICTLLGRS